MITLDNGNTYSLDPISIQLYSDEDLTTLIVYLNEQAEAFVEDNSIELANKIVTLSNIQTIIVELLSRFELLFEDYKLIADSSQAKATKAHREEWEIDHPGDSKYPASKYFEDLAKNDTLEQWKQVNTSKSMLTKFKGFRNNYETKINALKKLLTSLENIRY